METRKFAKKLQETEKSRFVITEKERFAGCQSKGLRESESGELLLLPLPEKVESPLPVAEKKVSLVGESAFGNSELGGTHLEEAAKQRNSPKARAILRLVRWRNFALPVASQGKRKRTSRWPLPLPEEVESPLPVVEKNFWQLVI